MTPETSTLGYFFTPFDDQECRDNFLELEQWYQNSVVELENDEAEEDTLLSNIIVAFERANMSIVDNADFIKWLLNFNMEDPLGLLYGFDPSDPLPEGVSPLFLGPNDRVAQSLLSSEGATPITDNASLQPALSEAFYQRADNFLEF